MPPFEDEAIPQSRTANHGRFAGLLPFLGAALLATLGFLILSRYAAVYWTDGIDRFTHREDFVVWRWLPAFQSVLVFGSRFTTSILELRALCLFVAVVAVVVYGFAMRRLVGTFAGGLASILFAAATMIVTLATQAYQEPFFVLALSLELFGRAREDEARRSGRPIGAARIATDLGSTLACMTRYEGWLLLAVFAVEDLVRAAREGGLAAVVRVVLRTTFLRGGLLIVLWIAFGPYSLMPHEAAVRDRLPPSALAKEAWTFLSLLRNQLGDPALALTAIGGTAAGLWHLRRRRPAVRPEAPAESQTAPSDGESAPDEAIAPFGAVPGPRGATPETPITATFLRHVVVTAVLTVLCIVLDPLPAPRRPLLVLVLLLPFTASALVLVARLLASPIRATRPRGALAAAIALAGALALAALSAREGFRRVAAYEAEPLAKALRAAAADLDALPLSPRIVASDEDARRQVVIHTGRPNSSIGIAPTDPAAIRAFLEAPASTLFALVVHTGSPTDHPLAAAAVAAGFAPLDLPPLAPPLLVLARR